MIQGRFLDARTSAPQSARIDIGADRMLRLVAEREVRQVPLDAVRISDRIGEVPRRVTFEDGASFETPENDAVDAALEAAGQGGFARRLARWERFWGGALAALGAVAVLSWAFVRFGVPPLADVVARAVPHSVDVSIGAQGLELLDATLLEPTQLSEPRQAALRGRLRAMAEAAGDSHDYRLEFRRGKRVGPNAFALPSGVIVVTDELVALAERDEEIESVLAHEVGHVRGRHSLRILLQNAGVAALTLAVLGDVGTASSLAAAVPVMLVQAKFSRDFERDADAYSRQWLRGQGLPESHFDDMMCRLAKDDADLSYLSSHPPLRERASC